MAKTKDNRRPGYCGNYSPAGAKAVEEEPAEDELFEDRIRQGKDQCDRDPAEFSNWKTIFSAVIKEEKSPP